MDIQVQDLGAGKFKLIITTTNTDDVGNPYQVVTYQVTTLTVLNNTLALQQRALTATTTNVTTTQAKIDAINSI